MAGWRRDTLYRGQLTLSTPENTVLTDADTYYKVSGTFTDGNISGFYIDNNKLIYTACDGCPHLFTGVSDLSADKVCRITYALFLNGVLVTEAQTPTDFEHANYIKTISISKYVNLQKFDELEIYAKSDTASTTISVNTLTINLTGLKIR